MKLKAIIFLFWSFQFIGIFYITISAQARITPIEKCNFEKVTSYDEMLEYLEHLTNSSEYVNMKFIGKSVQGRDIPIIHYKGNGNKQKVKVLVLCQQHGNEPSGKEASLLLINKLANQENYDLYKNLDLMIIPSLNPDGNEAANRLNANKEDLNRNHLLLTEPEIISLHKTFNEFLPEVTLDVHEYSAFRKSFIKTGYVRSTAEQFGALTNLNISSLIIKYQQEKLFPFLNTELNSGGVSFSNYYKINDPTDTVRSSTAGIIDGRQSFGILNTFSLILEGRNGKSFNSDLKRRSNDQLTAIESFLAFVNSRSSEIKLLVDSEREKLISSTDSVIIQMDYEFHGERINIPIQSITSLKDTVLSMNYSSKIKKLKSVSRPQDYIISSPQTKFLDLLKKHNIKYRIVNATESKEVEIYRIENVSNKWLENKTFKIAAVSKYNDNYKCKPGDIIIPLNQLHSSMISIALEPESMWGIIQSELYEDLLQAGNEYPIDRVINN